MGVSEVLESLGGRLPAPLEVGVWVDAWDESHSERMKEKTRGRAERSVGGAPGDGRDEKVPPGKQALSPCRR